MERGRAAAQAGAVVRLGRRVECHTVGRSCCHTVERLGWHMGGAIVEWSWSVQVGDGQGVSIWLGGVRGLAI